MSVRASSPTFFSFARWLGVVALVVAVGAIAVLAVPAWRTFRAWLIPSPAAISGTVDLQKQKESFLASFPAYVAQSQGRSLFYVPSAPGTEAVVTIEEEPEEGETPRTPSSYGGPAISAIVLDEVWFADGTRVKAGSALGDVEVLETRAPWEAKVRWRGGEFIVPLFARDQIIFKDGVKFGTQAGPVPGEAKPDTKTDGPSEAKPETENESGSSEEAS